jgi:hypothetical protein
MAEAAVSVVSRGLPRPASQPAIPLRRPRFAPTPTGAKKGTHVNDAHARPLTVGNAGYPHVVREFTTKATTGQCRCRTLPQPNIRWTMLPEGA